MKITDILTYIIHIVLVTFSCVYFLEAVFKLEQANLFSWLLFAMVTPSITYFFFDRKEWLSVPDIDEEIVKLVIFSAIIGYGIGLVGLILVPVFVALYVLDYKLYK